MVTLEELRKKHQELLDKENNGGKQQGGVSDYANFKNPSNLIRILPGKEDALDFFAEGKIHKFKDAEGKWQTYKCRKTHNEKCPICDLYFDLWKMHKNLGLEKGVKSKYGNLATQIKQKTRYYVKAVIRELQGKADEKGVPLDPVKYVVMSEDLFNRVMAAITNPDLADEDDPDNTTMLSLDRGNDFDVKITKKGEFNSFDSSEPKIKKTKAGTKDEIAAWMESKLDPKLLIELEDYEAGKRIAEQLLVSLSDTGSKPQVDSDEDASDDDAQFKSSLKA